MMVADTDVLIDYLAGVDPGASSVARAVEGGKLCTTVISRFELLGGARSAGQEARIRELLAVVSALPLGAEAADRAAAVRRALERIGQTIGMADSLIAGIVLHQGATLLTRNRRHFERVPHLLLDPVE
jgi:tRNA(fMet)-specific endonuclease VapC